MTDKQKVTNTHGKSRQGPADTQLSWIMEDNQFKTPDPQNKTN